MDNDQDSSHQVAQELKVLEEVIPLVSPSLNLSAQVGPWLRSAIAFVEPASYEVATELKSIHANWQFPNFRLAFIGEFSRGKSTLINRLLGQSILPVGVLPTTATLTSIIPGNQNQLEVQFSDGHRETRPLDESSWQDLLAINSAGKDQDPLADVRITLNQSWLHEINVELLDAPGASDLSGKRAKLISTLLTQCDSTVLIISATMPFSTTEAAFLEQEVIGRHIPQVLVVVSKLDMLHQEERIGVFKAIQHKVAQVSVDIPVLPLYPLDSTSSEQEVLKAVKLQIASMVLRENRLAWRSQRVAGQIIDSLDHLIEVAETAISAIKMSIGERTQALLQLQSEHRKADLEWERLRLELNQRRLKYEKKLRTDITDSKDELLKSLSRNIERTLDLKSWWEKDYPYQMRNELKNFGRRLEISVINQQNQDFEWLQSELVKVFNIQLTKRILSSITIESTEIQPKPGQVDLTDLKQQRFWARLSSGASTGVNSLIYQGSPLMIGAAVAAHFTIPIILTGIVASVGVSMVTDRRMQDSLEKQRRFLEKELETTLDKSMQELSATLFQSLYQNYQQLFEQTRQAQQALQTAKENAFKADNHSANEQTCQKIIDKATVLREEILGSLGLSLAN